MLLIVLILFGPALIVSIVVISIYQRHRYGKSTARWFASWWVFGIVLTCGTLVWLTIRAATFNFQAEGIAWLFGLGFLPLTCWIWTVALMIRVVFRFVEISHRRS